MLLQTFGNIWKKMEKCGKTWIFFEIYTLLHPKISQFGISKYEHFFPCYLVQFFILKIGRLCGRRISYNAVYNDLHILWENQIYETSTLFTEKENVSSYLNAPKTLSPQKCRSAEEIMVLPTTDEIFKLFTNFCSYVKISQKVRSNRWMTLWIGGSFCAWK